MKAVSNKVQLAKERGRPADWVNGHEVQTDEDRRRNFIRRAQWLEQAIKDEPSKAKRKELGIEKLRIQDAIRSIRPKRKEPELASYILEAAKERLTKDMFRVLVKVGREKLAEARGAQEGPAMDGGEISGQK